MTSATGDDIAAEVLALEERRLQAALEADADTLRGLFHPTLSYAHSSGARDDYQSMLKKVENKTFEYHWVELSGLQVNLLGDTAIVTGFQDGEISVGSNLVRLHNSTLSVWLHTSEGWKLVAFQPTPLQEA